MSYSHNAEADFAASELARMFAADPRICYAETACPSALSTNASYEPSSSPWPRADALVSLLEAGTGRQRDVAVEYKRQQEGLHGLLTAIGQAHSYLHKGYSGAAIVLPSSYSSHPSPGEYVGDVLDRVSGNKAIGVFRFETPDLSSPTPYAGRIHTVRPLELVTTGTSVRAVPSRPKTQWVHMREGSTTRDAFFRFLQTAKRLSADSRMPEPTMPSGLRDAIARLAPAKDPFAYLANTADAKFLTRVWRAFWFEWVATPDVLTPWRFCEGRYFTPNVFTRIAKDDGSGNSQIFEGRASGLKENIVKQLNEGRIDQAHAWEQFVSGIERTGMQKNQGVRDRAHSYREDLDSSLSQLQWIDNDGRPTDYGYRYMTICERYGGANSSAAIEYVGASLLQTGRYGSFLHYVHRLSERKFASHPLEFTKATPAGNPVFNEESYGEYLTYLEDCMADELKVMRKVSGRSRPRVRTPFQVELTLLRTYGYVSKTRYRLGVGIPIDWEHVVEALNIEL
jgi:hypothetical protein